jgi:hypothetical protein
MAEFSIDRRFIVDLKGREYPTWGGVLDAATRAGLQKLSTVLVQVPAEENGHMAIVRATAEFADGRVFEDLGDCSPRNAAPMIASAAIRMASTRAKGRCLRDAINCGMTMLEEIGPDTPEEAPKPRARASSPPAANPTNPTRTAPGARAGAALDERKKAHQRYEALRAEYRSLYPDGPDPGIVTDDWTLEAIQAAGRRIWPEIVRGRQRAEEASASGSKGEAPRSGIEGALALYDTLCDEAKRLGVGLAPFDAALGDRARVTTEMVQATNHKLSATLDSVRAARERPPVEFPAPTPLPAEPPPEPEADPFEEVPHE